VQAVEAADRILPIGQVGGRRQTVSMTKEKQPLHYEIVMMLNPPTFGHPGRADRVTPLLPPPPPSHSK